MIQLSSYLWFSFKPQRQGDELNMPLCSWCANVIVLVKFLFILHSCSIHSKSLLHGHPRWCIKYMSLGMSPFYRFLYIGHPDCLLPITQNIYIFVILWIVFINYIIFVVTAIMQEHLYYFNYFLLPSTLGELFHYCLIFLSWLFVIFYVCNHGIYE